MPDPHVLCLRPLRDFLDVGVTPPAALRVSYREPGDSDTAALLASADALVLPSAGAALPDSLFSGAGRLRLVQYTGAGWDRISMDAIQRTGATVANMSGENASAVAQYTMVVAGYLLRGLGIGDHYVRHGMYEEGRSLLTPNRVRTFHGLTVGIVGLGHIGVEVARLFAAAGASISFYDPHPLDIAGLEVHRRDTLDVLVGEADVLTVHIPLTAETRGLIGPFVLRLTKPNAVLVQASRGGIVDERVVIDMVRSGHLAGAAFDVYEEEPLPPGGLIVRAARELPGRLVLTPHIAGVAEQSARRLYQGSWDNVTEVLVDGQEPGHCVFVGRSVAGATVRNDM